VLFEKTRNFESVRGVPLHAQGQGFEPSERHETAERVEHAAGRVMQKPQPVHVPEGTRFEERTFSNEVGSRTY
jgi:hypothetical protein